MLPASYDEDFAPDEEPTSDRHATLSSLCSDLHKMIVGEAAEALLADIDSLPASGAIWAMPSWVWLHSRVYVGRKERAADGSRLRLPVRLNWTRGPVVVVADGTRRRFTWSSMGLGHSGTGTVGVTANPDMLTDYVEEQTESGLPIKVALASTDRDGLIVALERLAKEGHESRWQAMTYLEGYIEQALHRAHASVANELSVEIGEPQRLLDDTKLQTIADRMLLGEDGHPGKVTQLLERCLKPNTFARVEPIKYIKESLRRDANNEVRKALGDPHIGAKVRRVAREVGVRDLDAIIEAYREQYPNDRLSKTRALAALSVAPDAMAAWWELHPTSDGQD